MLTHRQQRLNRLFREEISDLLLRHLKDPRLGMISITEVQISPDLAQATVYVSVSGDSDEREKSLEGLASAAGHIRTELGKRLKLKRIPALEFRPDLAQERGDRVLNLLEQIRRESQDNE
jgi:ribosome-binding factor A